MKPSVSELQRGSNKAHGEERGRGRRGWTRREGVGGLAGCSSDASRVPEFTACGLDALPSAAEPAGPGPGRPIVTVSLSLSLFTRRF